MAAMRHDASQQWLPPAAPGSATPAQWDARPPGATPLGAAWPPPGWPPPAYAPPRAPNNLAVASLALGVGGLAVFVFSGFGLVFVLNLPPSILAWVLGVRAGRRAARGEVRDRPTMRRWGTVLGIVGTVLGVLAVVLWALAIVLDDDVRHRLIHDLQRSQ
jgi:hypothetical protein